MFLGGDGHLATRRGELSGVVGYRIDHEEREGPVCLHLSRCRLHIQRDALHLKTHLSFLHDVEKWLQREGFYPQAERTLAHLNPLRQHLVVLVDLVGEFRDVLVAFLPDRLCFVGISQPIDLVYHAVDERGDAIDKRHLGTLLQIATLVVGHMEASHLQGFMYFFFLFLYIIDMLYVMQFPLFQWLKQ